MRWFALPPTLTLAFAFAALVCSCGGGEAWRDVARRPGATEVVVLGSVHRAHLTNEEYDLAFLDRLIREIAPDVILVEVPPIDADRVNTVARNLAQADADPWLRGFPELSRVVFPVANELRVPWVPVSGFTRAAMEDRATEIPLENRADRELSRASTYFQTRNDQEDFPDNAEWVNGPEFARLSAWEQSARSAAHDTHLGNAGVRRLLRRHYGLIETALERNSGKRVLIVFAARARWYFERRLSERGDVRLLDVRGFLALLEGAE